MKGKIMKVRVRMDDGEIYHPIFEKEDEMNNLGRNINSGSEFVISGNCIIKKERIIGITIDNEKD